MEINTATLNQAKFSEPQIKIIAKAFWKLVEKYELTNSDLDVMLGKKFDPKTIAKYKSLLEIPKDDTNIILRVAQMLGIHLSLKVIYPHNPSLVYSWLKTKTPEFGNKSPLRLLKDSGVNSFTTLLRLRNNLDYKRAAG